MILRKTPLYVAKRTARGVRITVKRSRHHPKSRVVSDECWAILNQMGYAAFDASCVLELGIGVWSKRT